MAVCPVSYYLNSNAAPDFSALRPATGENYDPAVNAGWFDHTGQEAAAGIYRGALNIAETANLAAANIVQPVDWLRGDYVASDAYFNKMVAPIEREKKWLDAQARDSGVIANLAGGVTEFGTELLPAGVASLVTSQGIGRIATETRKGTALPTAFELGAVQAGTAGIGAMLPIRIKLVPGMGPAAFQRVVYGALTGTVLGAVEPGLEKQVYMSGGMPDEAAKINPLDAKQIVLNAALGGFLGYAGHRFPGMFGLKGEKPTEAPATAPPAPLVDAAMVANDQQHLGAYAKAAEAPQAGAAVIADLRQAADDGIPITQVGTDAPIKPTADVAMQQGADEIGRALGIEGESPRPAVAAPDNLTPLQEVGLNAPGPAAVVKEPPAAQAPEAAAGWSPRNEEGDILPVSFPELQNVAKRLADAGIEIPSEVAGETARNAVDSLSQSVDAMKKSDFYQTVIDEAASCILAGGGA